MTTPATFLMPAYNASAYIKEAIDSVLSQTYKDFILLIIDDFSQDNTVEIIEGVKDSRIKLIKNNKNLQIAETLNIGISNIDTPFILRIDSDDICHPQRLEKQINFMLDHPKVGVCGSYIEFFGNKKGIWKMPTENKLIKASLLWGNSLAHPSVIIRTEILKQNNIWYGDNFEFPFMQDYALWLKLLPITEFANIPETLVKRREHANNQTNKFSAKRIDQLISLYKWLFYTYNLEVSAEEINTHLLLQSKPVKINSKDELIKFKAWQEKLKNHFSRLDYMDAEALDYINKNNWGNLLDKIQLYNLSLLIDYLSLSDNKPKMLKLFLKKKVKKLLSP